MNNFNIGDKFAEYVTLITAAVSVTCNLCLFFVWQINITQNLTLMVLCSAAFLLLPCFFKKAAKIAAAVGGGLLLLFLFYAQIKHDSVRQFIIAMSAKDYVLQQSNSFISIFICVMASLCCLLILFASKSRAGILITSMAGVALVFVLSILKCGYFFPALLVFMGCSAVLYIRRSAFSSAQRSGMKAKGMVWLTTTAAAGCALALIFSQISFSTLSSSFGKLPKIDFSDVAVKITDLITPKLSKTGFGDYNPAKKLGGKITFDSTTVLEVETDGSFYLRGRIYDIYTGKSWQATTNGNTSDIYSESTTKEALGYAFPLLNKIEFENIKPDVAFNSDFYGSSPLLKRHSIKVTTKTAGQNYLFLPANIYKGKLQDTNEKITALRNYPDLHTSSQLAAQTLYAANYYLPDTSSVEFMAAQRSSASDYAAMKSNTYFKNTIKQYDKYNSQIRNAYMGTQNVTQRTRNLALSITKSCKNEFEKVDAIKNWLQKNCTYTLSPRQPLLGRDFVDFFLFDSHSGYCEHFATAMTVMLRAVGVPARYVEGYAAPSVNKAGTYEVTNRQAHAWTEYYSNMYGFLTVDPTPSQSLPKAYTIAETVAGSAESSSSASVSSSAQSSSRVSSSAPSSGTSSSAKASSPVTPAKVVGHASPKTLAMAAALGVAALILLLYGGKTVVRTLQFRAILRHSPKEQAIWLYGYFADALSRLGFDRPLSTTPNEFAGIVRGKIMFGKTDFDRITEIYVTARFGEHEISEEEICVMLEFYRGFMGCCRRYAGTTAFILKYPML